MFELTSARTGGLPVSDSTVLSGVYKVPYSPTLHRGDIKSVGEEYQAVKREYLGCGEEYNVEKETGEAISSSL